MSELSPSGSQYSDSQRIQAIADYAVLGVGTRVAERMNIPETTINSWIRSDWGVEALAQIRQQNTDEFISTYTKLVREGSKIALDKLPEASARDAMIIAATANDKLRLALNQPTSISSSSTGMAALAEQFRQLSQQWDEKQADVVAVQEQTDTE